MSMTILLSSFKFIPVPMVRFVSLSKSSFNVPAERLIEDTVNSLLLSVAPTVYVPVAVFVLVIVEITIGFAAASKFICKSPPDKFTFLLK